MSEWTHFDVKVTTTWHPVGRSRWWGPVRFEQRVNGQPTGLAFAVTRLRYILIRALGFAVKRRWPFAVRLYRRMRCEYRWLYFGRRGQA